MKTVNFSVTNGDSRLNLCGQAHIALAVLQALSVTAQRDGLTVDDVIDDLAKVGALQPGQDERGLMSTLLSRMKHAGLIQNPDVRGGSRRYIRTAVSVCLLV